MQLLFLLVFAVAVCLLPLLLLKTHRGMQKENPVSVLRWERRALALRIERANKRGFSPGPSLPSQAHHRVNRNPPSTIRGAPSVSRGVRPACTC